MTRFNLFVSSRPDPFSIRENISLSFWSIFFYVRPEHEFNEIS